MCFRIFVKAAACVVLLTSCSQVRKMEMIRSGEVRMSMSLPEDDEKVNEEDEPEEVVDSIRNTLADEPFIMNAIRDSETGEMVATDIIRASTVTARFRNVAERSGYVTIGFDVNVPSGMADSKWRLKLYPSLIIRQDTVGLEPLIITGAGYREGQLRGYERYRRFIASIVTDTTDFIRIGQLEIFLERHFPDTYMMKNDSSIVADPQAATLFGATQEEALRHYTMKLRRELNERRKSRAEEKFRKYVRDPIVKEGIRLDTVFNADDGDFVYGYLHTFKAEAGLKKVIVSMKGSLFADGRKVADLPDPDDLTFYISSLSSLTDDTPRYRLIVLERRAYDNTKAFLDFSLGSAVVDTSLSDNASELRRIRRCIDDVAAQKEFVLDSLLIVASCSPEGSWKHNKALSARRAESIMEYIREYVPEEWKDSLKTAVIPENWELLKKMVEHDTVMSRADRLYFSGLIDKMDDPDRTERLFSRHPQYRYLREKIYPRLRTVSFDFHLHRMGMIKDTVHTTELDTVYMVGVEALRNLDYKTAVTRLRPYRDYNSALAFTLADYDHSALDILNDLDLSDPKVCYLKAIILARLGLEDEALKYYEMAVLIDPYLRHRANLDPELSDILKLNN